MAKKKSTRQTTKSQLTFNGRKYLVWMEMLTPERAATYKKNGYAGNRDIRPGHVGVISGLITNGHWDLNGVPLIFDEKGDLIDGQHRCEAVIKANVSVPVFCIQGVRTDSYFSLDHYTSPKRFHDLLKGKKYKNSIVLAGAIIQMNKFKKEKMGWTGVLSNIVDTRALFGILKKHPQLESTSTEAESLYKRTPEKVVPKGFLAFLLYILPLIDSEYSGPFLSILMGIGGQGSVEETAAYQCRRRLILANKSRVRGEMMPRQQRIGCIIKAWNAFAAGLSCSTSRHLVPRPGDTYPKFKNADGQIMTYELVIGAGAARERTNNQ